MARSGLYKSDIQKARDSLRAQGKHPSVDAVRVALGDTGSKTTIHRYLKELEAEEGQGTGAQVAVSDALQDLIGRLAERLHAEADARIAEAKERFDAQLRERNETVERQKQETAALSAQLQRTEVALQAEKAAHAEITQALQDSSLATRQLEERVAGLIARITEHEAHARSLEEKHQHAREALEHYRTSVKDQREQEQRRHEQQLQELQVALRQANEALNAKNHELLQLNRDNVRFLELNGRLDQDVRKARADAEGQQQELDALRLTAAEHTALQARWTQDAQHLERLQAELGHASDTLAQERALRQQADVEALTLRARLEATEAVFARLRPFADAGAAASGMQDKERP